MIVFSWVWQGFAALISVGCVALGVMSLGVTPLPNSLALFVSALTFAALIWSGYQLRVSARILRDARSKVMGS